MDFLHEEGVRFIHLLQTTFTQRPAVDVFVEMPQYFADPDTLMIFAFPLLLAFNQWLACRFALTIGLVDMINTVLKWLLQGERPYWWVREANRTKMDPNIPELEHLPLTCETGPGSPSGHSMSAAAVGFVVVSALIDQSVMKINNRRLRRHVENAIWFIYGIAVALIGVARLRLATHFPHQVLLGTCAGVICGWLVWNLPIERLKKEHFYIAASALFVWAVVTYFGLQLLGVDPNRTLQLALKHCADRKYVKMSTTPWHSVYRNTALIVAVGFCSTSSWWTSYVSKVRISWLEALPIGSLSLVSAQALASIPYPHQPTYIFYVCTLIKNSCIVIACLLLVPYAILRMTGRRPEPIAFTDRRKKSSVQHKNSITHRQG